VAIVLISLLGRGMPAKAGEPASRRGYRKAKYKFPESSRVHETTLFGWALWQELSAAGRTPDSWLVLGTAGSMWHELAEPVPEALDSEKRDKLFEWQAEVEAAGRDSQVRQEQLDEVGPLLAEALGVGLRGRSSRTFLPCWIVICRTRIGSSWTSPTATDICRSCCLTC
jgi:hypothetical protein